VSRLVTHDRHIEFRDGLLARLPLLMDTPIQLREVFTPGRLPSVTYVSRDHCSLKKPSMKVWREVLASLWPPGPPNQANRYFVDGR
jgi:hypothetical protein